MRSASSVMSRVSARSSSSTDCSRSCRAADAGERVLDLVGEHGGKARHRAGGAAVGELPVHLVGHGPLLEHDHDLRAVLGRRRGVDVHDPLAADPRRSDVDAVLVDARAALADLVDQRQERAAEGDEVRQRMARQHRRGDLEESLRGIVRGAHVPLRIDQDDRVRQGVEDRRLGARHDGKSLALGGRSLGPAAHAAALPGRAGRRSNQALMSAITEPGSSACIIRALRARADASSRGRTSSVQPTCLRAMRRPRRMP